MSPRQSRSAKGRAGETAAAAYLEQLGYRIVARNVRYRSGEIDLVAQEEGHLVFIEVKTRTGRRYGTPGEGVTPSKQRQLVRLATLYLAGHPTTGACRFDVVEVEPSGTGWSCSVIRNAFSAS